MGTLCTVSREQQWSVSSVAAAAAGTIFGTEVRSGAVSELYSALCRTGATPHQLCWEPIYVELTKDYKSKTLSHKLTCINSRSIYNENSPKLLEYKIIRVSEELL